MKISNSLARSIKTLIFCRHPKHNVHDMGPCPSLYPYPDGGGDCVQRLK